MRGFFYAGDVIGDFDSFDLETNKVMNPEPELFMDLLKNGLLLPKHRLTKVNIIGVGCFDFHCGVLCHQKNS